VRVRFISLYYPPEVGAPQTRIQELAMRLSKLGHQVSVLTTFPHYPSGIVPTEWRGQIFQKGVEQGLTVYRTWCYPAPNRGFFKRIISQLSFALFATLSGLFLPRCDVLIVESPPLFDAFAGLCLSALRRTPFVFMVSDLWPESAVQMGVLRNRTLIGLARVLELLTYRRAAAILALTRGIKGKIEAEVSNPAKVILFRAAVDTQFFCPRSPGSGLRGELGTRKDQFLVLYAGTLGLAHKLDVLLHAAAQLQREGADIQIVFAGDGAEAASLKTQAQTMALSNVSFAGTYPKQRMPQVVNSADCVVVTLRKLEIFRGALPSKMFEAMACAKPILLAVAGEANEVLNEAGAGMCVAPEDTKAVHDGILHLYQHREEARSMGQRGREYVLRYFSRDMRAAELCDVLQKVVGDPIRGARVLRSEELAGEDEQEYLQSA
jgi:colanic acid biosynthesis glycosyl transferase WcaI